MLAVEKTPKFGGSRCRQTVDVVREMELNGGSVHRLATVATVCSYGRQTVESTRNRYVHSASPNPCPV